VYLLGVAKKRLRLPVYQHSLARALLAAREAVMQSLRPMLRKADITEQQWRVLRVLADTDNVAMDAQTLAATALLRAPSVTRIMNELDERGWITRRNDTRDARRYNILITQAGMDLLIANQAYTLKVIERFEKAFGRQRMDALLREIEEFTSAIRPED
jgi:homoprotocatechuate degradation regulator HpaR